LPGLEVGKPRRWFAHPPASANRRPTVTATAVANITVVAARPVNPLSAAGRAA
jgi:hypothetical protein